MQQLQVMDDFTRLIDEGTKIDVMHNMDSLRAFDSVHKNFQKTKGV